MPIDEPVKGDASLILTEVACLANVSRVGAIANVSAIRGNGFTSAAVLASIRSVAGAYQLAVVQTDSTHDCALLSERPRLDRQLVYDDISKATHKGQSTIDRAQGDISVEMISLRVIPALNAELINGHPKDALAIGLNFQFVPGSHVQ